MTVFKIVQSIMKLIESMPAQSAEDLFDIVACYFPITDTGHCGIANAKPVRFVLLDDFEVNGQVVVTMDALTNALNASLTCSPLFAEYCLRLVVEKLESDHRQPTLFMHCRLTLSTDLQS